MSSGHLQSDEIPDGKITHRYTAANQVRARDTALQSVVEDMKTILYWWEMPTRWHMMSEKQLSILIQGRNYARGNRQIIRIPRAFACISAGAPWLWRSVMQIDKVSQEPARLRMLTAPFHGTFFSIGSSQCESYIRSSAAPIPFCGGTSIRCTKVNPYFVVTGELWCVFCEYHMNNRLGQAQFLRKMTRNTFRKFTIPTGKKISITAISLSRWKTDAVANIFKKDVLGMIKYKSTL